MRCPHCSVPSLKAQQTKQHVPVDVCGQCRGIWLDRGVIFDLTDHPEELEKQLGEGLTNTHNTEHLCPRCDEALQRGALPGHDAQAEECVACGGLWLSSHELEQTLGHPIAIDPGDPFEHEEAAPVTDHESRGKARERLADIASGMLALPNLFLRSVLTLTALYALLIAVLIAAVEFGGLNEWFILIIGVPFALIQFTVGPWIMDLSLRFAYRFRWVKLDELPEHLQEFVERVCKEEGLKTPSFGIIDDGSPKAFTYGHHPGNARIVISRGILELLEPEEVEGVVAHEIGHARNWDMALMTVAHLVPLVLYFIYRLGIRFGGGRGRGREAFWMVALGAFVLYIVSEYIVLWFSRTREYFADRFAGRVTNNPNAVAMALVKIAYGLASKGKKATEVRPEKEREETGIGALRVLNIFDDRAAVSLVVASSTSRSNDPAHPDVENIKSAMQWDLWNPWAKWYELHSTHPLVAHRLTYLCDQAAALGQEPLVVFDRRKPESYWDDFFVDVLMLFLPWMGFLLGTVGTLLAAIFLSAAVPLEPLSWVLLGAGLSLTLAAAANLLSTNFRYRRDFFPHLSVAALMHKVKVSAVRPVPATLTGKIIGKGVPGLIWSKDFVLKDRTGILFLDYNQPLALWGFLFGLLRAGRYTGKTVRVSGWFRRAPVPYLEVNKLEVVDDSEAPRRCYSLHARLIFAGVLAVVGVVLTALAFVVK